MCQPIYDAGFLDGIGMQEHSNLNFPKAAEFIASYNKFDKVCNEMAITEFDISTKKQYKFSFFVYLQIPYFSPCIIRIASGDKVKVFKFLSRN